MLKQAVCWGAAAVVLATTARAGDEAPALFRSAQYVLVRPFGGSALNPGTRTEDRHAVADIENAVKKWGRYRLATRESQADLILVVRKGSLGAANAGVPRPGAPGSQGFTVGGEIGPLEDYLAVFEGGRINFDDVSPLWKRSVPDGLKAPALTLFEAFRQTVEGTGP